MKKKYGIALIIIGSIIVILSLSYAYFTSSLRSNGVGVSTTATTVELGDVGFIIEGTMEFNDLDIYPGHKNISSIKVTANGQDRIAQYNLIWEGTNTLNTPLKYYVYKTTSEKAPNITCTKKEEGTTISKILYEECSETNFDTLGSIISSGEITTATNKTEFTLVENELIKGTTDGNTVYYYVVLEYPNLDVSQNIDMGGSFEGVVTVKQQSSDTIADITISKIYEQNGDAYNVVTSIPTQDSGYTFNSEKSTCTNNATPTWNDDTWKLLVTNLTTSGTTCNVYFDINTMTIQDILATKTISTRTDFSTTLTTDTTGIVYSAEDDDGTSYYYAGAPTDNWVKFGGFYWRIIRINGDGTIRMIYQGTSANTTGAGTQIGTSAFNSSYNNNMYVGYMYTSGQVHGTGTASTIKGVIDSWYDSNLASYASYIDTNAGFCNDRQPSTNNSSSNGSGGTGTTTTYYGAYMRFITGWSWKTTQNPTLKCPNSSDLYTLGNSNKGNKALSKPIGLITADEVVYGGGFGGTENSNYYLYTGQWYWTMSPASFDAAWSGAYVYLVYGKGTLGGGDGVNLTNGVRPVINLKSDTQFINGGTGTAENPYVVEGAA